MVCVCEDRWKKCELCVIVGVIIGGGIMEEELRIVLVRLYFFEMEF